MGEPRADDIEDDDAASTGTCHRRDCAERAAFRVLERYQEETGQGAVEATADLCRNHAAAERPANLDGAYEGYVFRVEPLPGDGDGDAP